METEKTVSGYQLTSNHKEDRREIIKSVPFCIVKIQDRILSSTRAIKE